MTKQEFIKEVKIKADEFGIVDVKYPTDEEYYEIIEFVCMHHPSIEQVNGKEQIALLYLIGGIRVIEDMYQTANKKMNLKREIVTLEQRIRFIGFKHIFIFYFG